MQSFPSHFLFMVSAGANAYMVPHLLRRSPPSDPPAPKLPRHMNPSSDPHSHQHHQLASLVGTHFHRYDEVHGSIPCGGMRISFCLSSECSMHADGTLSSKS
ncbi:hypothetical protein B0T25DRAFT_559768 [Lasiosphaeria hispida]|uniref:Uncharacterized protein n=1 Tax=Lasiosphaeria hispida TaxID=260671 RepID=A0AAJ0H7I3_9PEZI|nr:hypothetical protein B0T25DRAFT_559768 [Lasiosphaeria hispida]